MRSQSAWTRIDLEGVNASFDGLELQHISAAPLSRAPVHYSREKYVLNASCGVPLINVHGVYEVPAGLGVPGQPLFKDVFGRMPTVWPEPQLLMDESVAHHFHFVNVGRDRSRDKFISDATVDSRAQETIAAQLDTPRGRIYSRKVQQLRELKAAAQKGS